MILPMCFELKEEFAPIPWSLDNGVNFQTNRQVCPCDFTLVLLDNFVVLPLYQY